MLNCLIVGAGRSGSHLMMRPLKNLKKEVNICAICDQNLQLAEKVAEKHGILNTHSTLAEALSQYKIDFVCVSTPHSSHYEVAKLALENNCSVIIEKPFTETLEQAHKLIKLATSKGQSIVVMHNHKFYRGMVEGKELLGTSNIGTILNVHCDWISSINNRMVRDPDHWVHNEKGGIFKEVLPHALYGTYNLLGALELVDVKLDNCQSLKHIPYRGVTVHLKSKQDIPVTMRISFDGDYQQGFKPKPIWLIQGSKDVLIVNYAKSYPVLWNNRSILQSVPKTLAKLLKNMLFKEKALGAHNYVITRFIDHIKTGSKNPVSEEEIMNTMIITDQICSIIEEGKGL